jgi:hypothetical protein
MRFQRWSRTSLDIYGVCRRRQTRRLSVNTRVLGGAARLVTPRSIIDSVETHVSNHFMGTLTHGAWSELTICFRWNCPLPRIHRPSMAVCRLSSKHRVGWRRFGTVRLVRCVVEDACQTTSWYAHTGAYFLPGLPFSNEILRCTVPASHVEPWPQHTGRDQGMVYVTCGAGGVARVQRSQNFQVS